MLGIALQQGAQAIKDGRLTPSLKTRTSRGARTFSSSGGCIALGRLQNVSGPPISRLQRRLACCVQQYFWSQDAEGTTVRRDCLRRSPA
jgi:hypothetical protein